MLTGIRSAMRPVARTAASLDAVPIQLLSVSFNLSHAERTVMPFVNELVSEEDNMKYGLDELLAEFNAFKWKQGRPPGFSPAWTIDRERDMYFVPVKSIEETGPSGRPEPTAMTSWILNWRGRRALFTIERVWAASSRDFRDSPFRVVWDLKSCDTSGMSDVSREQVIGWLKEALTAYGHFGAKGQVPNTVVSFMF